MTYKAAGVDIDAGSQLVERIKPAIAATHRPGVLGGLGGFGGLFELPISQYREPVLVSGTDGVGTKLKLAVELNRHETIGIDLVAMCANDVLVMGAEPLFFLDYYATGHLDLDTAATVVSGIAAGCKQAGAALIGGETAEMPGLYAEEDYDLAGFCVGIVEKSRIITGDAIRTGDWVLGLASSGPHANGYSLIRKILAEAQTPWDTPCGQQDLASALLTPTRIYTRPLLALLAKTKVHGLAHITGGGLVENVPRILPRGLCATLDEQSWEQLPVFDWIHQQGKVSRDEMLRTFNCGIGMVLVVDPADADASLRLLREAGETVWPIGQIESNGDAAPSLRLASD
jgi:phosphoribosylformylglycinamidine cyclo-ligase